MFNYIFYWDKYAIFKTSVFLPFHENNIHFRDANIELLRQFSSTENRLHPASAFEEGIRKDR